MWKYRNKPAIFQLPLQALGGRSCCKTWQAPTKVSASLTFTWGLIPPPPWKLPPLPISSSSSVHPSLFPLQDATGVRKRVNIWHSGGRWRGDRGRAKGGGALSRGPSPPLSPPPRAPPWHGPARHGQAPPPRRDAAAAAPLVQVRSGAGRRVGCSEHGNPRCHPPRSPPPRGLAFGGREGRMEEKNNNNRKAEKLEMKNSKIASWLLAAWCRRTEVTLCRRAADPPRDERISRSNFSPTLHAPRVTERGRGAGSPSIKQRCCRWAWQQRLGRVVFRRRAGNLQQK